MHTSMSDSANYLSHEMRKYRSSQSYVVPDEQWQAFVCADEWLQCMAAICRADGHLSCRVEGCRRRSLGALFADVLS